MAYEFSQTIPLEIRKAVRAFKESQYELLQAFGTVPYAMQMATSNPALLYALVRNDRFATPPVADRLEFARRWILKKQKRILQRLGFPEAPGKSSVPVLKKIAAKDVSLRLLRRLRQLLQDPALQKILHFTPTLDAPTIEFVWMTRELLDRRAISQMLMTNASDNYAHKSQLLLLARDTICMWRQLGRPWPPARKICGLNAWEALHRELCEQTQHLEYDDFQVQFAMPALPEAPHLRRLDSVQAIIKEGKTMGHCVASYIPSLAESNGRMLLYAVHHPERCTLCLKLYRGRWFISQLAGPSNKPVTPATWEYIESWLRQVQQPAPSVQLEQREQLEFNLNCDQEEIPF